jgi:hypothetical protein
MIFIWIFMKIGQVVSVIIMPIIEFSDWWTNGHTQLVQRIYIHSYCADSVRPWRVYSLAAEKVITTVIIFLVPVVSDTLRSKCLLFLVEYISVCSSYP